MQILVIEDEIRLATALTQILTEQKFRAEAVYDGLDGYNYAKSGIYDCILLDVMMPGMNGFDIVSELRKNKIDTPILLLTARDSLSDKVKGLDLGADDYMTKPFEPEELLARIRVLTRRKGEVVLNELSYEDLTYSLSSSELLCSETQKSIRLSFKEAELIKLFLSSPKSLFSKEDLIVKVWGYDAEVGDNNVEAYISFLRKKLDFVGSKCEILSIKKVGYKLEYVV